MSRKMSITLKLLESVIIDHRYKLTLKTFTKHFDAGSIVNVFCEFYLWDIDEILFYPSSIWIKGSDLKSIPIGDSGCRMRVSREHSDTHAVVLFVFNKTVTVNSEKFEFRCNDNFYDRIRNKLITPRV